MDIVLQTIAGTFMVTVTFLLLFMGASLKEQSDQINKTDTVYYEEIIDEEIEEVTYEELDEQVSFESLKQRSNQINARYKDIG